MGYDMMVWIIKIMEGVGYKEFVNNGIENQPPWYRLVPWNCRYISMPFVYPILWPWNYPERNDKPSDFSVCPVLDKTHMLPGWMMFFFGIFGDSESLPSPLSTRCWRASAAMFGSPEQLAPGTPKAWCFLWLPSELRKTSEDLQYDVYNIFSIFLNILYSYFDHINNIISYSRPLIIYIQYISILYS